MKPIKLLITHIILAAIICSSSAGCTSLVLRERERALDEAYENSKIDRVHYNTSKNDIRKELESIKAIP